MRHLTGGEIGLTVPDVITISDTKNYEIALWFMAVSGAILFALSRSPVGLILQASGQDAVQAGALGFNVTKHKLAAFIISAFFSGLAGAYAGVLSRLSLGRHAGRHHGRRADHHRRGARRPAHHPRRRAWRGLSDRHERGAAPDRRSRRISSSSPWRSSSCCCSRAASSACSPAPKKAREHGRWRATRGQRPHQALRRPRRRQGNVVCGCRPARFWA